MSNHVVTRTRQDLINSGDAFKMSEPVSSNVASATKSINPNDQSAANHQQRSEPLNRARHKLGECCYSVANLILIVASIVALVVLARFIQDEALYEYIEYLLSLAFHRELIFIMVILPLVLLVPISNALGSFLFGAKPKAASQNGALATTDAANHDDQTLRAVLRLKLAYQVLMFLLAFLALVFVVPYTGPGTLSAKLELEIRKHMRRRYDSNFSYELIDVIQEEYQCCDELWYRANLLDRLPTSCFVPGSQFSVSYTQTCSSALGWLISVRCAILAACLLLILVALASLFAIDLTELLGRSSSKRSQRYQVEQRRAASDRQGAHQRTGSFQRLASGDTAAEGAGGEPDQEQARVGPERQDSADLDNRWIDELEDDNELVGPPQRAAGNRLGPFERGCEPPLLAGDRARRARPRPGEAATSSAEPILLAHANYQLVQRERSQSPLLKTLTSATQSEAPGGQGHARPPIKSALKRSSSGQELDEARDRHQDGGAAPGRPSRVGASEQGSLGPRRGAKDDDNADDDDDDDDDQSLDDYAERLRLQSSSLLGARTERGPAQDQDQDQDQDQTRALQREQPTRRSLLSVRFAD